MENCQETDVLIPVGTGPSVNDGGGGAFRIDHGSDDELLTNHGAQTKREPEEEVLYPSDIQKFYNIYIFEILLIFENFHKIDVKTYTLHSLKSNYRDFDLREW